MRTERKLTASQLANALGVHVNTVKHHVNGGMPYGIDGKRGVRKFNEKECRKWLASHGSVHYNKGNKTGAYASAGGGDATKKSDPNSPLAIELRLKLAKIDEIETKTAERKGTLVNAQQVQEAFTAHLTAARTALESVPIKAAAKVLAALELDNAKYNAIVAAIRAELEDAMQSLSGSGVEVSHAAG